MIGMDEHEATHLAKVLQRESGGSEVRCVQFPNGRYVLYIHGSSCYSVKEALNYALWLHDHRKSDRRVNS